MERLTEHFTHEGISYTTLRALDGYGHIADEQIVLNRLSAFEDFMEKYGFNSIDDLKEENLIKQILELKEKLEEVEGQYAYECECNKQFVECQNENERLKKKDEKQWLRIQFDNETIYQLKQQLKEKDEKIKQLMRLEQANNNADKYICQWIVNQVCEKIGKLEQKCWETKEFKNELGSLVKSEFNEKKFLDGLNKIEKGEDV